MIPSQNQPKDDIFRRRLALAAECLPEIRRKIWDRLPATTQAFTQSVKDCVDAAEETYTTEAFRHLVRAYPALARGGCREGIPFLDWLGQLFKNERYAKYGTKD